MKLFVIAAVLGVCAAGRLDNTYLPPGRGGSGFGQGGAGGFGHAAAGASGHAGGFGQRGSAGFGQGGFGQGGAGHGGFGQGGAGGFGQGGASHGGFGQTQHGGNIYNAGGFQQSYNQQSSRPQDAGAQILRSNSEVTAEGFSYDFETSNGIRADAQGVATNGVQSQGSFGYKGDDGQDYSITYTADENGYRPQGAHLPTPPPIPEEILKSLEQNARDEAAGISDDGSYHGEGAGSGSGYSGNQYQQPSNQYGAPSRTFQQPKSFGGSSNFGGSSFGGSSNFGGAASRQYLAPKAGPNGSGNFNSRTGYQY
ncbi:pupal cuticle protein 36a-like [Leguminivora glycinivorella]|uniref:pupal cuticle protein 36a-like n=1 Tax=Leguminivora glycinivorella TaxID=1035111 RepID=UPI00200FF9CF|nr:pupal cuticle protein 36a-like [Leguminivora glycinivorella]